MQGENHLSRLHSFIELGIFNQYLLMTFNISEPIVTGIEW
jgi:hypothetical protein